MSKNFRYYTDKTNKVAITYKINHENQTVDFVKNQINKYCTNFNLAKMTVWQAIQKLDHIIDESDPDLDKPQIIHAFQTAEALRRKYPDPSLDYLPLVGILHDLGKIISLPEYGNQPQWATVGDIFPVGCKFSDKIVYPEFFSNNPDSMNPIYNTEYGIYKPGIGLDNIFLSFGHDYYMYSMLKHNNCKIPELGLSIIRYHSFYAWHKEGAYEWIMEPKDYQVRDWVQKFSHCDLYTKDNSDEAEPDTSKLAEYYQSLIDKYFPSPVLEW